MKARLSVSRITSNIPAHDNRIGLNATMDDGTRVRIEFSPESFALALTGMMVSEDVDVSITPTDPTPVPQYVGNLLAVIHGDGGHHMDRHGVAKSCVAAEAVVYDLRTQLADAKHFYNELLEAARGK